MQCGVNLLVTPSVSRPVNDKIEKGDRPTSELCGTVGGCLHGDTDLRCYLNHHLLSVATARVSGSCQETLTLCKGYLPQL